MLDITKQEQEDFFKIEENLLMLHCMEENLRLISTSYANDDKVVCSALYGIATVIDEQIHEIENKLGHTVGP